MKIEFDCSGLDGMNTRFLKVFSVILSVFALASIPLACAAFEPWWATLITALSAYAAVRMMKSIYEYAEMREKIDSMKFETGEERNEEGGKTVNQ